MLIATVTKCFPKAYFTYTSEAKKILVLFFYMSCNCTIFAISFKRNTLYHVNSIPHVDFLVT